MAAKEKDYSRGSKESEYLGQKNKPKLCEVEAHHCFEGSTFCSHLLLHIPSTKTTPSTQTQLTPQPFRGKGGKRGLPKISNSYIKAT